MTLLPSVLFVIIFRNALFAGKTYGNRLNQQQLAIELGSYYSHLAPDAPLFTRKPEILHPDYHLLYEPAALEVQKAFQNGRLPLYNPHRLLGTPLWGSPVVDAANPLSLLLICFSPDRVHLIKIFIYTIVSFTGVYFCAISIFDATPVPAAIGASLYLLNPFMYYMYHWAELYGVVALVPALFCVIHVCLTCPLLDVSLTSNARRVGHRRKPASGFYVFSTVSGPLDDSRTHAAGLPFTDYFSPAPPGSPQRSRWPCALTGPYLVRCPNWEIAGKTTSHR